MQADGDAAWSLCLVPMPGPYAWSLCLRMLPTLGCTTKQYYGIRVVVRVEDSLPLSDPSNAMQCPNWYYYMLGRSMCAGVAVQQSHTF